jgi:cell division protein FtsW
MGTAASVTPTAPTAIHRRRSGLRFNFDIQLILIVIALLAFGLTMLYSASWDFAVINNMAPTAIIFKQLRMLLPGLLGAFILANIDYHKYKKIIVPAMGLLLVLLVLVLIIGHTGNGPARGIFSGSVQPSEFTKLGLIVYLSFWLFSKQDKLSSFSFGFLPVIAILCICGGLVLLQPDLSAAATIVVLGGLMFFMAGADWKQITMALAGSAVVGWIGLKVYPTGATRFADYINGLKDLTQSSYHIMRALEGVIKGGWFGVGIGQADVKFTGLPFPYTDSIYAVVVEETGLIGAMIVVILFTLLLWRGLIIARNAPDQLGSLLAAGLTIWITLEAMMNIAVIIGLFPFAGNALPFFSAGGSNLITTLAAIGIILNVSRQSEKVETSEGRSLSAFIGLRGGNGRRRVSRSRRSPITAKQD